ncbi:MAG: response regulator [Patescibacteria group bacterium]|nr:response regulator [Patescibacteria group bacterium]
MKKILLIEDEALMRRMFQRILTKKDGFQLTTATSGEEGLKMIKKEKPDLVLLDLILPKMPGEQVLKTMNDNGLIKKIPVIVLSCKGDEVTIQHCLNVLGACDYLHKGGFQPKIIVRRVRKVLKKFKKDGTSINY